MSCSGDAIESIDSARPNLNRSLFLHFFLEYVLSTLVICGDNRLDEFNFIFGPKNDEETNPVGHWPWMASLGFFDGDNEWRHFCGATLVSDRHFLTAAHCLVKVWLTQSALNFLMNSFLAF